MDPRYSPMAVPQIATSSHPEYSIAVFSDPSTLNALLKAVLHTIFFHRYFTNVRPATQNVLHLTLPYVEAPELNQLIDTRIHQLNRQLNSTSGPGTSIRGGIGVQFYERKRRLTVAETTMMNMFGIRPGDGATEDVCWETWRVEVSLAIPRTPEEQKKVTKAMETSLRRTVMKIISAATANTEHIPPIHTQETNPFPYQIILNPKSNNAP